MKDAPTRVMSDQDVAPNCENIPPNLHHEMIQPPEDSQYRKYIGM